MRSEKHIQLSGSTCIGSASGGDDSDSPVHAGGGATSGSDSDGLSLGGGTYPRTRTTYRAHIDRSDSSDMSRHSSSERGLEDGIDWRERCHSLEASLHKFKHRAAQIRELLAAKVHE